MAGRCGRATNLVAPKAPTYVAMHHSRLFHRVSNTPMAHPVKDRLVLPAMDLATVDDLPDVDPVLEEIGERTDWGAHG